jgi:hypothetical protein
MKKFKNEKKIMKNNVLEFSAAEREQNLKQNYKHERLMLSIGL